MWHVTYYAVRRLYCVVLPKELGLSVTNGRTNRGK